MFPKDRNLDTKEDLENRLLQGINSGPSAPWTADDWTELRRHIHETAAEKLRTREAKE